MEERHELRDEQWELVEALLPKCTATTGRPPRDRRVMLNGMLWILYAGTPWRDLDKRFGPWQTVSGRFVKWRSDGVFDRVVEALQIKLDKDGLIDWDLWCVDGANVRAARAAGGADKKVSNATPPSQPTTLWAAARLSSPKSAAAGLDRSSTSLLKATEFPSPSR